MDFRRFRKALTNKLGAVEDRQSDHAYYYLVDSNSNQHRIAKISHSSRGSDEVLEFIISDTTKRMKLNKQE